MKVLFLSLFFLLGCYEGWKGKKEVEKPVPVPSSTPEKPIKEIAYIFFQPIVLSAEAMGDTTCFDASGTEEFRATEWQSRIAKAEVGLAQIAELVERKDISIEKSDCILLDAIHNESVSAEPWSTGPPDYDLEDRSSIHLRAIFWDTDVPSEPSTTVMSTDWLAVSQKKKSGVKMKTLTYSVRSNVSDPGYFQIWLDMIKAKKTGSAIEEIDPTEDGLKQREATIAKDTGELISWVKSNK